MALLTVETPESSSIRRIGYNPLNGDLRVEFNKARRYPFYRYPNISPGDALGFIFAPSHGQYFHSVIKNQSGGPTAKFGNFGEIVEVNPGFVEEAVKAVFSNGRSALQSLLAAL